MQVAKLAGVPPVVIKNAEEKLRQLEVDAGHKIELAEVEQNNIFFKPEPHPVIDNLMQINLDQVTAPEALVILYELKSKLLDG